MIAALEMGAASAASPLALTVRTYLYAGFRSVLAIAPGEKWPGSLIRGAWYPASGWQRYATHPADTAQIENWMSWSDAGIGIALGFPVGERILIAVDVDLTDPDQLAAIRAVLPWSPMTKTGARGFTAFVLADPSFASTSYKIAGLGGVDLLGPGRQTVCPPSIHPSGVKYRWLDGCGVVPVDELPEFTTADQERLEAVLRGLGWRCATHAAGEPETGAQDAPSAAQDDPVRAICREVNDRALADLRWVEELGLSRWKRVAGGYDAVPEWRPSGKARPLAERALNLKIRHNGIRDFGGGEQGLTAIDLVMAATGKVQDDAFRWLSELTRHAAELDIIPVCILDAMEERTRQAALARHAANEARQALPPHDPVTGEVLPLPARAPASPPSPALVWERHGEASPFTEPFWLIKGLVPTEGNFLLAGVSTAGKTFVAVSLAVALATGDPFMDMPIRQQCGSLFLVGEGRSTIRKRLRAAVMGVEGHAGAELEKLPISFAEGSLSAARRGTTVAALKAEATRMERTFGAKPGVLFVDTLAACFEFEDENSSAEATKAMNAIRDIGRELGCLVITTAHHGKNEASGVRGSSAFTASADDILTVLVETADDGTVLQRQLRVAKTRDGEIGRRWAFDLVPVTIGQDRDGDDIVSAYVAPNNDGLIVRVPRAPVERLSSAAVAYLAAFAAVQVEAVNRYPFGADGAMIKATPRDAVRREFFASYPAEGDTEAKRQDAKRKAFTNGERALVAKGKLVTRTVGFTDYVWQAAS